MASDCQTTIMQSTQCNCHSKCGCGNQSGIPCDVTWVQTTIQNAQSLGGCALVAGHENNSTPIWVIRARIECNMIPGKLTLLYNDAFIPWSTTEYRVKEFEVLCARPENIKWIECCDGHVPPNAVKGGWTACGETLYVGRAPHDGSLTPGMIRPSTRLFYMTYGKKELSFNKYEVLCTV